MVQTANLTKNFKIQSAIPKIINLYGSFKIAFGYYCVLLAL